MKRIVLLLIILAMVVAGFSGPTAVAQDDLRLSSLWVRLWPEYDRPDLLVIYIGELAESTSYPATVSLRMPVYVTTPHVVAVQNAPGESLDESNFEMTADDQWRTVTFVVNGPRFQFEYYSSLARSGVGRQPTFTWPGDYAVDSLVVEFQQPPHASELTIEPALGAPQVSQDDGLLYYVGEFGTLAAGESVSFQASYTREEDTLTIDLLNALQADSGASAGTNPFTNTATTGAAGGTDLLLVVLVAVVSFLFGAASMRIAVNLQARRRSRR